eukprot:7224882-Alexandrium_andersonii.AAC.1
MPFFVVDQFRDITTSEKLGRTQGVKHYAGAAKQAESELRKRCLELVNSQGNVERRAQDLVPLPPRGEGMFTFPETILE